MQGIFRKFVFVFSIVKNEYDFSNINSIIEYDGNNPNVNTLKQLLKEIKENYDVAFNNILKLNEEGILFEYMSLLKQIFYLRCFEYYALQEFADVFNIPRSSLIRYANFIDIMPGKLVLKIQKVNINLALL